MVEPFWTDKDPDIALFCGDNRIIMPQLEAESVDSIVTDPPYELSNDGKASANRILLEMMFPQEANVYPDLASGNMLSFFIEKILALHGCCRLPAPTASMPEGAVTLNRNSAGGDENIKDTGISSITTSDSERLNDYEPQPSEHLGSFIFELTDSAALLNTLNHAGCGFLAGALGVGLRVSPASLPSLFRDSGIVNDSDAFVGSGDYSFTSFVGTLSGTEVKTVARFSLSRGSVDSLTTTAALVFLACLNAAGAKIIRTLPATGGLPAVLEARRVSLVSSTTNRTLSFDLIVNPQSISAKGFMGKTWDGSKTAYDVTVWIECLRVLKPGGHLLAFGGSRTYHRLACAIEDAGFEIRDQIQWLYGSGFPKSLDVSKQVDLMEKDAWQNIKELFDKLDHGVIIEWWTKSLYALHCAELVGSRSLKNRIAVGFNTQENDSVRGNAPQLINQQRLPFDAIIAELQCCEALRLSEVRITSARANADIGTVLPQVRAVSVEQLLQNPSLKRFITASIAQGGVRASLNGRAAANLKDEEALKTWLGKKKCFEVRDIDALCAGLTDGLKLTILSQSKTFLNLDTQSQTECVSAMTATTTASTAANLISFTVDTLRDVAIDAAKSAERQVIGSKVGLPGYSLTDGQAGGVAMSGNVDGSLRNGAAECAITAPATDAAKQWNGWGTALKPAHEPIVLARKPLGSPTIYVREIIEQQLRDSGVEGEIAWKDSVNDVGKQRSPKTLLRTRPRKVAATSVESADVNATENDAKQTRSYSDRKSTNGRRLIETAPVNYHDDTTENCEANCSQPTAASVLAAVNRKSVSSLLTTSRAEEPHTEKLFTERSTPNCEDAASLTATESFAGIATGLTGSLARVLIRRNPDGSFEWPNALPAFVPAKPLTVAENVLQHGTGGLNIDGCRIEGIPPSVPQPIFDSPTGNVYGFETGKGRNGEMSQSQLGRWPANVIHDGSEEVLAAFPQTAPSHQLNCVQSTRETQNCKGAERERIRINEGYLDSGSAARFFYIPKADKADRNEGLDSLPLQSAGAVTDRKDGSAGLNSPRAGAGRTNGSRNPHPTVKPTDLMRYLCRLITPPKGLVLDPFCGSGSTGKAARAEGFRFIGIEINEEYCALAAARCEIQQRSLFGE